MTTRPAYHHLRVREDWLALGVEAALEPDRIIVDPHHHLWDLAAPGGRYLFPDLLADMNCGHDVRASVFVQCRAMYRASGPEEMRPVGEVEFVNGVAAQAASGLYGRRAVCAGIVGFADLARGDRAEPILEALIRAGGGRLRGIRVPVVWHADASVLSSTAQPPKGLMLDARFQEGVRGLPRHDLSLDIWAYHTQMDEVESLARAAPGTTMIVDHLGGPIGVGAYAGRRDEVFAVWRASMARLAALPNVVMKVGGLGMRVGGFQFHEAPLPPTSAQLAVAWKPYVETAIDLFGAKRCMFETNFPVDKGMYSAGVYWNACKRLTSGASDQDKTALFSGTAMRVYRLDPSEISS